MLSMGWNKVGLPLLFVSPSITLTFNEPSSFFSAPLLLLPPSLVVSILLSSSLPLPLLFVLLTPGLFPSPFPSSPLRSTKLILILFLSSSLLSFPLSPLIPPSLLHPTSHLLPPSLPQAVFSWWCEDQRLEDVQSHPSFSRSTPMPSRVLLSLLRYFRWAHVGIISSPEPVWAATADMVRDI